MRRLRGMNLSKCCWYWLLFSLVANFTWAQSETATISGQVLDPFGLNVVGAQVKLVDIDRDTGTSVNTNGSGLYTFPSVRPGRYRMEISAAGFRTINVTGLTVNVQDHLEQNFKLVVGSISESITVEGGAPQVDADSAAVSTVVDRQFAENLPLNGRSFQTLIDLTPGVVVVPSNPNDSGQFSVNGQRAASNYWMVDGVSANIGISSTQTPGNGLAGALGSFSALGGTNSLVSVDAMQEFRIQTSTYAPEFGRTPGAQISIVTRSGTNRIRGTLFDYLRNDLFDASDWFNGYTNNPPLSKARERQNDFGGTFEGPILRDHTFFFFSYEGLRLRLPETTLTNVPDAAARKSATPALQPFLDAFPLDPSQPDLGNGVAQFDASYSNPAALDAYSLRVDHHVNDKLVFFGRYNYSPSSMVGRGAGGNDPLSNLLVSRTSIQTTTLGATWIISPTTDEDFRFNYARADASSSYSTDNFGGAIPLMSVPFPDFYSDRNAFFQFGFPSLLGGFLSTGKNARQLQRQFNLVDSVALQRGTHNLKLGLDFRRLTPLFDPALYQQAAYFTDMPSAENGSIEYGFIASSNHGTLLLRDLGLYAQDTWHASSKLTLTYGLRWDLELAPSSLNGPTLPAVSGFDLNNLSGLALAPAGTAPYKTVYGNFAPRIGVAYQFRQLQGWETVLRGGFGVFYDLASSELGNLIAAPAYPFGASATLLGPTLGGSTTFPFSPASAAPPSITPPNATNGESLSAVDPHLELPYTLEWNVALEQALGAQQTISGSYVGAAGRRLLGTAVVSAPNPSLAEVVLLTNAAESSYNAFQLQFQRRLSRGFQVLASYTWAHSIDTASAGSTFGVGSNALVPSATYSNRGPSDFDIRNAFSAGATYNIPAPKVGTFANAVLGGWSVQDALQLRSAPPLDISDFQFFEFNNGVHADIRPDLIQGQPLYLYGTQCESAIPEGFGQACPGGKAINPNAFQNPPVDPSTGNPLRQGDVPRNFLRAFGAIQWDLALHRDFRLHEPVRLQFRTEVFNVLNHPNFGPPINQFGRGGFGLSDQMLAQYLDGAGFGSNAGGGSFSPLYQIGGPRSMQFALKLLF